jgi:uncharacterized protein (DUF952 family)
MLILGIMAGALSNSSIGLPDRLLVALAIQGLLSRRFMSDPIYKICSSAMLQEARGRARFEGSADDARDGFIHLSAGHQVAGTLATHFVGQTDLVLLAVDPDRLGARLRWEPSRGGELFPHLYGPLDLGHVISVEPLVLQEDGTHRLPDGVAP